jgi:hypothetical protein
MNVQINETKSNKKQWKKKKRKSADDKSEVKGK